MKKNNYIFELKETGVTNIFLATAVPKSGNYGGERSFCVVEDGDIHVDPKGEEILDYEMCKRLSVNKTKPDETF